MTRLEALEAVAEAARMLMDGGGGPKYHANWNALAIALNEYRALDALPAEPVQERTVTLEVWAYRSDGELRFALPGREYGRHCGDFVDVFDRLGTVTLPLDREAGR